LFNGTSSAAIRRRESQRNGLPVIPKSRTLDFESSDALLDFVTKRWRDRWVTTSIQTEDELDAFSRRPFFLLVAVDAPLTLRWKRFVAREAARTHPKPTPTTPTTPTTLEAFAVRSDEHLYAAAGGQLALMARAAVRLVNTSADAGPQLQAALEAADLLAGDRLRPSWDTYFMALASLAARRSNCMKRRVGCVLVRGNRVVSTGYNGTPRGLANCGEGGCARCNGGLGAGLGLAACLCIHAEENALLEAGRERIPDGATLYCDTCPCLTCSIKIVQVGIREVVYSQGYSMDQETAAVFREAGVRLRQFVPVSSMSPPPMAVSHEVPGLWV